MSSEAKPSVLVVGAGPTGLTLAAALAQSGVKVRIIDKGSQRSDRSKALGVQAGTLECLEKYFGRSLASQMIDSGHPARKVTFHVGKKSSVQVDLSAIPSTYNFILILEQSETERILEELLNSHGISVQRNYELTSVQEQGNGVLSQVRLPSGEIERIESDFVVGCDGAHSRVRHELEIPFAGGSYTGDFILADVTLQWPWEYGGVRTFIERAGIMACFPMRGQRQYRIIVIKSNPTENQSEITLEEFRKNVSLLSPEPIQIESSSWLTRFPVHHRMTDRFRKGRIFLAGDAAHIHSPVGGQGMNTGIQDALNLGNRLVQVLVKGADPSFLDGYEANRRPIARQVLKGTDFVSRFGVLSQNTIVLRLREMVLPLLLRSSSVQKKVATAVSQVNVARREISQWNAQPPSSD